MARIRTVKPQFFLNEELSELPAMVRLLFIGLWTQADREGRLIERPKRLKAEIFPYDNFDMEKGLRQLSDAGFIFRYKVNANGSASILAPEQPINELALIQIVNFSKHQKIDIANEKPSELPSVPQDYQKSIDSLPKDEERKGKEEERKDTLGGCEKNGFTVEQKGLFEEVKAWIKIKAPRVLKMPEPLTISQYFSLKERFPDDIIADILIKMHNWTDLKKRETAYYTFLTFAERRQNES